MLHIYNMPCETSGHLVPVFLPGPLPTSSLTLGGLGSFQIPQFAMFLLNKYVMFLPPRKKPISFTTCLLLAPNLKGLS